MKRCEKPIAEIKLETSHTGMLATIPPHGEKSRTNEKM